MPHIHTGGGEHDLTASSLIFRISDPEPRILLHQHKKLNKLMQPGGHVELDENPWQAVKREIIEETGYSLGQLKLLQPSWSILRLRGATSHPIPFSVNTHPFKDISHFHTDLLFVFTSTEEPEASPAEGESNDLRWLTEAELEALDDSEVGINVREIILHAFKDCLPVWDSLDLNTFE